jgi:hypothetical protein
LRFSDSGFDNVLLYTPGSDKLLFLAPHISVSNITAKALVDLTIKSGIVFFSFRIGSDEEDNDSDQEENKDSELETAVSRQEINLHQNEMPISTELNSNGHVYILVNRSANNDIGPENEEIDNL